jgi:radical SAM protein with 4Fe4S-binding SPASM domain
MKFCRDFFIYAIGDVFVEKEFDVEEIVGLPLYTVKRKIDSYTIVLAPEYPNWIVLDEDELWLYKSIECGKSIIQAMDDFAIEKHCEDEKVIEKITSLLTKIDDTGFYKDTKTIEEDSIDSFNKLVHVNLTNNCNLRCAHCYMSAGKTKEIRLDVDNIVNTITRINEKNGTSDIVISGGEPFMFPKLLDLLKKLSKNKIILFTNGTFINENNYKLICEYCDEVQISFEGITENCYEQIRGKGNYTKVRKAIELLKSEGMQIVLAITLLPMMLDDVRENLSKFVEELDYTKLEVRINNEIEMTGNAVSMDFTGYNKHVSDDIILELLSKIKQSGAVTEFPGQKNVKFTNCGIGANIVINYDGRIYPCHKFNTPFYFEKDTDIDTIFKEFDEINRKTSSDFMKKCQKCELRYVCAGGCRIDNYNINGDMMEPICNDEYKENQYRKLVYEYLRG